MPFTSKTSFSQPIFATKKVHCSKLNLLDLKCNISTNQQHIIRQDHHTKSGTAVGIRKCKRRKSKEEEEGKEYDIMHIYQRVQHYNTSLAIHQKVTYIFRQRMTKM